MQVLGYIFLGLLAVAVLVGLVFTAVALPDIARYFRIRRM
jgi:hypothetical protein